MMGVEPAEVEAIPTTERERRTQHVDDTMTDILLQLVAYKLIRLFLST
jgi:hypothetical protein